MAAPRKPFVRYRSTLVGKKWDVYVPTSRGLKKVSYGQAGASDYTLHKDRARRERYRSRHSNDRIDDPYAPGFWSYHALWGASADSKTAFRSAVVKAKRLL
jgi:hypothetical protein